MKRRKVIRNNIKNFRRELFSNIKRTISLYLEIDKKVFILFIICITIVASIPFAISYIWAQIINDAVMFLGGDQTSKETIIRLFCIAVGLEVIESITWKATSYLERISYLSWHEKMGVIVSSKVSELDFEKYEDSNFNNFINKILNGYSSKPGDFAHSLIWIYFSIIQLGSAIFILMTLNPILLPIILISLVPSFLVQMKSSQLVWGIWDAKGGLNRLYNFTSGYLTNQSYIKEIRLFGVKDYLSNLLRNLLSGFLSEQKKILNKTQKKVFLTYFLEVSVVLGVEIWLIMKVLARQPGFGIGNFTFYRNTIRNFTNSSRHLFDKVVKLYDNNLYMTDLFHLMDVKREIISKSNSLIISKALPPKIEFKNVSFTYPNSDKPIYQDFSITINPGEDIALVGENGAGKTTFIKLLLRLYDVTGGEILVNGTNIKDINLESYYKNIGVLFQDFNKYAYTVRENIELGDAEKSNSEENIIKAAEDAGASKFIQKYPLQYDQVLSNTFDNGIEPSGGQWQRIALARGFFRDANILILDEPTAAIDPKGESEIFNKIFSMQEEKTTIIISHRFSTVKKANKIYVVEEGKIIEEGNHTSLMKIEHGKYKEMFEVQAEGYK